MAEPSAVYQGNTPTPIENTGLNATQLALANYMAEGSPPPFAVNQGFLGAMTTFTDSGPLSPFTLDTRTGLPRIPDLKYVTSQGIAYVARGEDIYLLRRALDCGPDEYRFEEVYIGRRPDVAEGTWAFYGSPIRSGTVTNQSSYIFSTEGSSAIGAPAAGFSASPTSFGFAGLQGSIGFGNGNNDGSDGTGVAFA